MNSIKGYNNEFVFFCKSYIGDLARLKCLIESYNLHNKDDIKLIVSVPQKDLAIVSKLTNTNINVISDESYASQYLTKNEYWGLKSGYINQEICKLAFWESGMARYYFCIDSDLIFLRDFYQRDFFYAHDTPYQVLCMDKDLKTQIYYYEFSLWRQEKIEKIYEFLGMDKNYILTCHGMTMLCSVVLADLNKNLLRKKRLTYEDLIRISPYEFSWYNAWLQKRKIINFKISEPIFKTFHTIEEYKIARASLLTTDLIATQYIGIVLNSNWNNDGDISTLDRNNDDNLKVYKKVMEL